MDRFLFERELDSHKGDYGHLFIIGGSPGLTGAVCLSGLAALRSGCGLATIGIPESLNQIIEIKLTEVMSFSLPETKEHTFSASALTKTQKFIKGKADGVVIGPGISLKTETQQFVKKIIQITEKPLVIDADAIKIISSDISILKKKKTPAILTPHPGEMGYLIKKPTSEIQKDRVNCAKKFASEFGVIVILKGYKTIITDGKNIHINLTGNSGMATAGSGDVLSGIIGSFLVQGIDPFQSAKLGVHIHGLAGDLAAKEIGETSLIASDLIEYFPHVFKIVIRGDFINCF